MAACLFALVNVALGRGKYVPLLITLLVFVGALAWTYTRAQDRSHEWRLADPATVATVEAQIARGQQLGFNVARVFNVTSAAGTKIVLLTMHDGNDTRFDVQTGPKVHQPVVSFSTAFNECDFELITSDRFLDYAPKARQRVVEGQLEDLYAAHRSDIAALVQRGQRPMTSAHYNLFDVSKTMLSRHSSDMSRSLPMTLFRQFIPDAGALEPLTAAA